MALISCPECGSQVSDRAAVCIHCGFPINEYVLEQKENAGKCETDVEVIEEVKNIQSCDDVCPRCGGNIDKTWMICMKCGWRKRDDDVKQVEDKKQPRKDYSSKVLGEWENKKKKKIFPRLLFWSVLIIIILFMFVPSEEDVVDEHKKNAVEGLEAAKEKVLSKKDARKTILQIKQSETETEEIVVETEEIVVETEEIQTATRMSDDERFVEKASIHMSEELALKLYVILTNDIGFSEVTFLKKIDGTYNYEIHADGHEIVATDMGNEFRIFKPHSNYVFYENGEVLTSKEEMDANTIDIYDRNKYYSMAQMIVEQYLKDPSSADFPSIITNPGSVSIKKNGELIAVKSYVTATNSFGAKIKRNWLVQFMVIDIDTYQFIENYIEIDGESAGEFIEME